MTDKYNLNDLISSAAMQEPLEFHNAFNDLVVDKIRTAVENKKVEIAQQMYNYEPPENFETDENDDEFGANDAELENSEEETDGEES
jgi:hypothetical protein